MLALYTHRVLIPVGISLISGMSYAEDTSSRQSFDLSSRMVYSDVDDSLGFMHAFGIDYHKVVSNAQGDIGTLTAQLYVTRIDNLSPHPPFFDDKHDTELVTRIFNFNYTGLGKNLPNIKVGHIELPFGSEYRINTNGTLLQYTHPLNLGPKADWGVSINKQNASVDYEVSLTTGGGQSFRPDDASSYVLTGYIGTPSHHDFHYGFSFNQSKINQVERENYAVDVAYYKGLWGFSGEWLLGEKNDVNYQQGFTEVNWRSPDEKQLYYLQFRLQRQLSDWSRQDLMFGTRYHFHRDLVLSAMLTYQEVQNTAQLSAQLRWRF